MKLPGFLLYPLLAATAAAQVASPAPSAPAASAPTVIINPAAAATPSAATPLPTATPAATPTPLPATAAPAPELSSSPGLLKKIGVKLQFLPPPMEGTISLGIYNHSGKLVRVVHRTASGDEFVAALDGYITHWDGLDDAGQPLPPGHYTASGFMVGAVSVKPAPQTSGTDASPTPAPAPASLDAALPGLKFPSGKSFSPQEKVHVGLVANPLDRDRSGAAEVSVGFDAKGSWLQLADGLPLKQISATPNLKWIAVGRSAPGEPLVVFQSDGATLEEYIITKVSNMMAFDCGSFDFTGPGKP